MLQIVLLSVAVLLPHSTKSATLTASVNIAALPGTTVIYQCSVTGNMLLWTSSAFSARYIAFIRPRDSVGFTQTDSGTFTAVLTDKGGVSLNSSLQFTAVQGLNGTAVNCSNSSLTSLPNMSKTLLIASPPMPPTEVSVLNYTLSSATVQWSAPAFDGLSDVTNYVIGVWTNDKTIAAIVSMDAASRCATIAPLQYGMPYTFEIKAFNSVGGSPGAVSNFTIAPEELHPPSYLKVETFCDGKEGRLNVALTWDTPKQEKMTPPLLFVSLNYSTSWNSSIHVKLPPISNHLTIRNISAGITLFAVVSVLNEVQESKKNPTVEREIDCHLSTNVVSIGSTNASIECEGCGFDVANSACAVLYKECEDAHQEEWASVGYSTTDLSSVYRVNLFGLSPNKTYCYRAILVLLTEFNCRQTYGLFTTIPQQCEETRAHHKNEMISASDTRIVAGTGAGALLLGMLLASIVCCFVVKGCRRAKSSRSAKTNEVPAAVNELCVKKLEDVSSRIPHQDDYTHIYDHVFEVSTNSAYGNIVIERV